MLQYVCDWCGNIKQPDETWLLGFAAERLGVREARREVAMAPAWDENRAVHWFAVHFCSEEYKTNYIAQLFGEIPPREEVVDTLRVSPSTASAKTSVKVERTTTGRAPRKRTIKRRVTRRRVA